MALTVEILKRLKLLYIKPGYKPLLEPRCLDSSAGVGCYHRRHEWQGDQAITVPLSGSPFEAVINQSYSVWRQYSDSAMNQNCMLLAHMREQLKKKAYTHMV